MEATDWDLQAVVRGCGRGGAASRDPFSSFPPLLLQNGDGGGVDDNDMLFCFSNLLGTEASPPELEQLYKPYFPQSSPSPPQQQKALPFGSPTPTTTPCSSAALVLNPTGGFGAERTSQQRRLLPTTTTRSKRRKSQQKRVVCHVPADGLSCDVWAWRKYGQKPIKGSPYPRGYYRCSSSKGCLARKQVERCRTDPGVFVITYTAEHNHPIPTHRNSLAGSTRQKLPDVSSSSTIQRVNSPSRVACSSLSPITPLTSSMDEEPQLTSKKEGREEVEEDEDEEEGMLLVSDMEMLGEDDVLFLGVDDIHQTNSDYHFRLAVDGQ